MRNFQYLLQFAAGALTLMSMSCHAQMSVAGQLAVSPSGAATYSIPVQTPPGIAGVAPKLALNYSSQSGNGLLGVGWGLAGLSAITRCPKTVAQDGIRGAVNNDMSDRYCVDGQRLIATTGTDGGDKTEYHTEQDGFSRVVSYAETGATNGPGSFVVTTKAGLTMEYGKTEDSRIEAQGKIDAQGHGVVTTWALSKVSDAKGNTYTVSYTESNSLGQYYPSKIEYKSNSTASQTQATQIVIYFDYETRPDVSAKFRTGSYISSQTRLKSIRQTTNNRTNLVYNIYYDPIKDSIPQSAIKSISISDQQMPAQTATFSYNSDGGEKFERAHAQSPAPGYGSGGQMLSGDFNGDGLTDIMQVWNNSYLSAAIGWISNGTGGFSRTAWASATPNFGYDGRYLVGDFNGDGLSDIAQIWSDAGRSNAIVWLSNGNGFNRSTWAPSMPSFGYDGELVSGDFNGDGRADIAQIWQDGIYANAIMWISSGKDFTRSTWAPSALGFGYGGKYYSGDFNGDGLSDIVQIWNNNNLSAAIAWISDGKKFIREHWVTGGAGFGYEGSYIPGDYNGDGLSDIMQIWNDGGKSNAIGWVSTGRGFSRSQWASSQAQLGYPGQYFPVDLNGDGLTDIVQFWDSNGRSRAIGWASTSTGLIRYSMADSLYGFGFAGQYIPGDFYGSGVSSIMQIWDSSGLSAAISWRCTGDQANPRLTAIGSSLTTLTSSIDYKTLPQMLRIGDYISPSSSYPRVAASPPLYLTSSISSSFGGGAINTSNYQYGGLLLDSGDGRGLLGFQWMQTEAPAPDPSKVLRSRTYYRQDFPFTGMVDKSTQGFGGSIDNLSQTTYEYGCYDFDDTAGCQVAPGKRYFPYLSKMVETAKDLNGKALPGKRTETTYKECSVPPFKCFGNATQVKITTLNPDGTDSGYVKTTDSEFANDETNWILGRLLRSKVTSTTP
jgi:Salmonella virulence plasmid 65kDa B protein/FG-GAP-like repeat